MDLKVYERLYWDGRLDNDGENDYETSRRTDTLENQDQNL